MNKAVLMGRLTRDPEVRYSQGESQTAVARFSLAVDRRYKRDGEPEADFFNCTAFGKLADTVGQYLSKGVKVVIVGRIQNDNYTNREGQQVYSVRVIADEMYFAEKKAADSPAVGRPEPTASGDGFMNIPDDVSDDDLPF